MYNDNWSSDFLKEKLKDFSSVKSITKNDETLLKIERKRGDSFLIFTMSLELIELKNIEEIVKKHNNVQFITNIKKEYNLVGWVM